MSPARMLWVVLAIGGCASHTAVKVRCDGRLVQINAAASTTSGKPRIAPVASPSSPEADALESSQESQVRYEQ